MDQDTTFSMDIGLGPGHILLDGDPDSSPEKVAQPPLFAHVYCGRTAEWTKMPLGMEVGPGPGHIVLDGVPAPPNRAQHPRTFPPMSIVAERLNGSRCHMVRR